MLDYDFSKGHIGINLYSALINKELSDEEKAKLIAEAVEEVAKKFPNLENLSTKNDVELSKLQLQKEIKELDIRIKDVEVGLTKEIESSKSILIKWSFGFWISQMLALIGIGFMVLRVIK